MCMHNNLGVRKKWILNQLDVWELKETKFQDFILGGSV